MANGQDAIAATPDNLALYFQELFTGIVRLRSHRQDVSDAEQFRGQVLHAIRVAEQNAKARGYNDDDISLAIFAVVAFLDESILNLRKPVFNDWVRKPLQEELFGRHVAGELFFENLSAASGPPRRAGTRRSAGSLLPVHSARLPGAVQHRIERRSANADGPDRR